MAHKSIVKEIGWFKYCYLLMIILYAGQSTIAVEGLVAFDGHYVGFLFPILMTLILLMRNRVNFWNKNFLICLSLLAIWFIIQYVARNRAINMVLTLFHFYQLFLCFIVIQVYGSRLFWVYEDITYRLTVFSLIFWALSVVLPNVVASFMHLFNNASSISEGSFIFYTMMKLSKVKFLIRNAGFAWEPGRFSCFLSLSIFFNLLINGFSIKKNRRLWIFIIALLTTQSTTGIFTLFMLMAVLVLNKRSVYKGLYLIVLIPAMLLLFRLDFAGEDLRKNIEMSEVILDQEDREGIALDRFESLVVEWENWKHDPIIGYCETRHSYVENYVFHGAYSTNGTMQLLAKYGLLGLLYYLCILISSIRIAHMFNDKVRISFLLLFMFISMSYIFHNIVLIMAFSFMGLFAPKGDPINRR